jgi:hypothetical protein
MNVIDDLITRIEGAIEAIPELAVEVIEETKTTLEELNIMQLQQGERADGQSLKDYSPVSVAKFGKPPGPMKLFHTGDYYEGIKTKVFQDKFELIGTDEKSEMLTAIHGPVIGVNDQNLQDYTDFVFKPELLYKFRNRISK